jgi:hypothetical protein
MAFTEDELQSLNTIVEQKLAAQRQELEQDFEQRLTACYASQQQFMQATIDGLQKQQSQLQRDFQQRLMQQSATNRQDVLHALQEHTQSITTAVAQSLDAQLQSIGQLLNQRPVQAEQEHASAAIPAVSVPDFAAIEVQAEIPWDELVELMDGRLDERITPVKRELFAALKDVEHHLALQVQMMQDALVQERLGPLPEQDGTRTFTDMQDVFRSIGQLEHLIEAMQVAMTSNSALLAKHLYHHQQLPLERAHPLHHMSETLPQQQTTVTAGEE